MSQTPSYLQKYELWLNHKHVDDQTKRELLSIQGQPKEIEDRFYKDLEFGTGGLRGVIGAGTNRMNVYTVRRATQGFAQYLLKKYEGMSAAAAAAANSVVIAYDSRRCSPEFAEEAGLVLAANGIKAYVFEELRPTPELSFAVRELRAQGGIVITASHNPPEYNGYKVYGEDGSQVIPEIAGQIIAEVQQIADFSQVKTMSREEAARLGLYEQIGEQIDERYVASVASLSLRPELIRERADSLAVIFTPLHGAGNKPVRAVLQHLGFNQVTVVPEQEQPDSQFSTVKSPNPEEKAAFRLAIDLARRNNADIILGTDPDCDRVGVVVRNQDGEFEVLTGNQTGAILTEYLLSGLQETGCLPADGVIIKTIVTSELGAEIARHYGVETINTLTGFKYIGEKIREFEQQQHQPPQPQQPQPQQPQPQPPAGASSHLNGHHNSRHGKTFLFGYEESYGYLAGTFCRDKDAVIAGMLACEAALYYKTQQKSLQDVLSELYQRHGYYEEALESRTLKGIDGVRRIQAIMEHWRNERPAAVGGESIAEVQDFLTSVAGLRKENVLKFILSDGSWFCLRPSGTEPKIKIYFSVKAASEQLADQKLTRLIQSVMPVIDSV